MSSRSTRLVNLIRCSFILRVVAISWAAAIALSSRGSYQRRIATVSLLGLNYNLQTCFVDPCHEPDLVKVLAVRARHPKINLMLRNCRTESCCKTQRHKIWDDAHSLCPRCGIEEAISRRLPKHKAPRRPKAESPKQRPRRLVRNGTQPVHAGVFPR
jgi:hypothetical protein